jgi:hypothetical protein
VEECHEFPLQPRATREIRDDSLMQVRKWNWLVFFIFDSFLYIFSHREYPPEGSLHNECEKECQS